MTSSQLVSDILLSCLILHFNLVAVVPLNLLYTIYIGLTPPFCLVLSFVSSLPHSPLQMQLFFSSSHFPTVHFHVDVYPPPLPTHTHTHNIDSSSGNENTPDAVVTEEDKHTEDEQREKLMNMKSIVSTINTVLYTVHSMKEYNQTYSHKSHCFGFRYPNKFIGKEYP